MEFKVTLDREAFKVLASDTRLDILKALDERPMTVSELGRKLDLNKATVFEHLERLVGAELVKKNDEEDRKWVYYALTWKAKRILHPERVTIALLLSTALGALLSGIVVAASYLTPLAQQAVRSDDRDADALKMEPEASGQSASAPPPSSPSQPQPASGMAQDSALENLPGEMAKAAASSGPDPTLLYAAILLFALVAVLAGIAYWYWRQAKKREAAAEAKAGSA